MGTAAAVGTLIAAAAAQAQIITIDGDTTGAPTFNRATANFGGLSGAGSAVPFNAIPFTVTADGNVRVETIVGPTTFDTVAFVYTSFDPANALANGVAGSDDTGGGPCGGFNCSLINQVLPAGQYVAVVTGFNNTDFGVYRLEIEGPVLIAVLSLDSGIAAVESGAALLEAQTQGLRQIVRANSGARQQVAAGSGGIVSSMNGFSTEGFSIWAEIGGGQINADFGNDLDITHFLGQAGVEMALSGPFSIGIGIGGGTTSADTAGTSLDGDAFFAQPYLAYNEGPVTAIASFVYTHTTYDDSNNVIDDGDRFGGSLSAGYDMPLTDDTVMTPFGYIAGGWETFDTNAGDEDASFFVGRAGIELSHRLVLLNTGTLNAFGSAAAEYITLSEPELGAALQLTDYDDDRLGGRVEVGFDFTIAGTDTQLFASGFGGGLGSDAPGFGGRIGISMPF